MVIHLMTWWEIYVFEKKFNKFLNLIVLNWLIKIVIYIYTKTNIYVKKKLHL